MINKEMIPRLIEEALEARKMAYTPYSHFQAGAELLTTDSKLYRGCNIENAAYTPTNCAERTAFFKAVSEGKREFTAIAIVGGAEDATEFDWCAPCGVCRQVMEEFCDEEAFEIVLARSVEEYEFYTLKELFPKGFGPKNLKGE